MEDILNKYKEFLIARSLSLNYHNIMRIFLFYLKDKKIEPENITQKTITDFFNSNSSYSISTKNQFIKAGRNFYSFIGIENNEWTKIKLMKTERKIPDYLTEEEIERAISFIITYHSKRMTPIKIRALLHFLFYSGVRKNEILILKRNDFNFEDNTAKVYGKGKKQRIICFPKNISKEIQDYFSSEPEINNCFNVSLGILNYLPKLISKHLNKKVYPHLFRHSFARNLIYNKGVDINTVSKLLGHSSISTTLIYINPDEKAIKDNYKKLVG
jgi:site-specific recombinase XerD